MEPFRTLTGVAAHLPARDINTDMIMPTDIIIRTTPEKMGGFALYPLRFRPDGSENPEFVLNQPRFRGAPILITGENFGCGSAREFAASGLYLYGIRALIGTSFGPIFYANCFQNGLLPIILPAALVAELATQAGERFTIDLSACRVIPPKGAAIPFEIEPLKREQLLTGLDAVGLAAREIGAIEAFQNGDRQARPWIYDLPST